MLTRLPRGKQARAGLNPFFIRVRCSLEGGKRWNYFTDKDLDAALFAASFGIRGYRSLREIAEVYRIRDYAPEPILAWA